MSELPNGSYIISVKEVLDELRGGDLRDLREQMVKSRITVMINTVFVALIGGGMSLLIATAVKDWDTNAPEYVWVFIIE